MSTSIEWTRGDDGTAGMTWNPTSGCDRISPGCTNCYALKMAGRLKLMGSAKYQRDGDPRTSGPGFGLTMHHDALALPLQWRKPRRIFVDSMSDLFHRDVTDEFIAEVFAVMALAQQHTFQVLTKRPQRMAALLADDGDGDSFVAEVEAAIQRRHPAGPMTEDGSGYLLPGLWDHDGMTWPLPNVHAGTSIESDAYTWRADHLRNTPAAVRFLSLEPLLGPLPSLDLTGIDWVIVGGESGPGASPMHPDWVRDIRDRCVAAYVPFFFKQRGSWTWTATDDDAHADRLPDLFMSDDDGRTADEASALAAGGSWTGVWKVDKKAAGRDLDGRTWDEFPGDVS